MSDIMPRYRSPDAPTLASGGRKDAPCDFLGVRDAEMLKSTPSAVTRAGASRGHPTRAVDSNPGPKLLGQDGDHAVSAALQAVPRRAGIPAPDCAHLFADQRRRSGGTNC